MHVGHSAYTPCATTRRDAVHVLVCRYNVLYGSAGFNPFGYQAGCIWVTGSEAAVAADPVASRYICANGPDNTQSVCTYDSSSSGLCFRPGSTDDFATPFPFVRLPPLHRHGVCWESMQPGTASCILVPMSCIDLNCKIMPCHGTRVTHQ